jgi:hypothetical protein
MKQHVALVVWALAPALALGAPTVEETGPVSTGLAGAVTARALGPTALAHNPAGMALAAGMALDVGGGARLTVYQAGTPPASGAAAVDGLRRDARSAVALDVPPAVFGSITRGPLTLGAGLSAATLHTLQWTGSNTALRLWLTHAGLAWRQGPVKVGASILGAGGWHRAATQGPGAGVGALAGVLLEALPSLTVGAAFQTRLGVAFAATAPGSLWSACLRTPAGCGGPANPGPYALLADSLRVGLAWQVRPTTAWMMDASLTLWGLQGSQAALALGAPGVRLRDTLTVRTGVEQALFFLAPDLKARVGAVYAQSPVVWGKASRQAPLGDRVAISAGLGWRIYGVTLDAGYLAEVSLPRAGEDGRWYRGTSHTWSAGVGYRLAP